MIRSWDARCPWRQAGPDPEKEDRVMLTRNRVSRIYYGKKFYDYPVKVNATTIKNMGFATTMVAGFSYLKAAVAKKPEDSPGELLYQLLRQEAVLHVLPRATQRSCGDVTPVRSTLPGARSVPRDFPLWES